MRKRTGIRWPVTDCGRKMHDAVSLALHSVDFGPGRALVFSVPVITVSPIRRTKPSSGTPEGLRIT